jgi:hypothetical protein
VGKYVVFYRRIVVRPVKSLLAMASSIVIKRFTFAVLECLWLNNTIKHFKQWRIYCFVVAGLRARQADNVGFGLLSYVPWNMYPNWISSNECSDK